MKVAIFTDTFLPQVNGVTNTLYQMKGYMDKKGIEYRFAVPGDRFNEDFFQKTISFQSFNFFLYPECKISLPRYQEVRETMGRFNPDVIHIVTPFSLGLTGLKYAKDAGIPLVSSYHTNFPQYLRYYNFDFLENALWHFFRWFHSNSCINFCPSRDTLTMLYEKGIRNLEVWGRGIDTQRFSPAFRSEKLRFEHGVKRDTLLLYVGRIAPEKELSVLMDAVDILNAKGLMFKLLVVGDGPSRQELEDKNPGNVVFTGYKSGLELQRYYASSDIFVFPSGTETYGNVILEAMASGLPVVAAYSGGIKENLMDMYNGIAFEPGDSEAMAAAIQTLIQDKMLRERLAENARSYSQFRSWDSIFDNLFQKYRELIESLSDTAENLPA